MFELERRKLDFAEKFVVSIANLFTFPVISGLAMPLSNIFWYVEAAIERNNASVAHHFNEYHHSIQSLNYLNIIVVRLWQHTNEPSSGEAALI